MCRASSFVLVHYLFPPSPPHSGFFIYVVRGAPLTQNRKMFRTGWNCALELEYQVTCSSSVISPRVDRIDVRPSAAARASVIDMRIFQQRRPKWVSASACHTDRLIRPSLSCSALLIRNRRLFALLFGNGIRESSVTETV